MVAYKTVIAPGEYYITPGVAVVSKLHWSLPRFKAALSLLTARAPAASLHPPPGYKKSIGFQIAEERTRLILNGDSSRACLFSAPLAGYDEGNTRGLGAPTRTSDTSEFYFLMLSFPCGQTGRIIPLSHGWQRHKVNVSLGSSRETQNLTGLIAC